MGAVVTGMSFTLPHPWMIAVQVIAGLLLMSLGFVCLIDERRKREKGAGDELGKI